jgi:phosphate transport system permease protein
VSGDASRVQRDAAARARPLAARRRRRARRMTILTAVGALATVAPLASILGFLVVRGAGSLNATLLAPSAAGGDTSAFANALGGSLVLLAIACALGVPAGLGAGLWLHERRGTRRAALLRYLADVLLGVPAIVFGVVAWQLLVRPAGHFSAWAGGAALAALIIPLVARTTDDVLALVPAALSEAALALGYPRWRTALGVVLRSAMPGVVTGVLVAVARVAGEAAPLLFTAFGNQFWSLDPGRPIAALPLQIYTGALGASELARRQAYAGALVLIAAIALFGLVARRTVERAARAGSGR